MFSGILWHFLWSNRCWQFDLYSAFSKSSLNIWKFMVCVVLKPGLHLVSRFSIIYKLPLAASLWWWEPLVPSMPESLNPLGEFSSSSPVRSTAVPPAAVPPAAVPPTGAPSLLSAKISSILALPLTHSGLLGSSPPLLPP